MKKIVLLLLLFIGVSSFTAFHKFYVSVTEIEYNEKAQSLQIISRVFTDDFENVLKKRYGKDLRLEEGNETPQIASFIQEYLEQKLQIKVDNKPVEIRYLGKEYENDVLLLYIEVPEIHAFQKIAVSNYVLMDLFQEQKNLVHVEYGGKTKSLVLLEGNQAGVLNFKE
jgi:hypothetical protein